MTSTASQLKSEAERLPGTGRIRRLAGHIRKDDVPGLAAETAFFWIFAIPPLMILIVMAGALFEDVADVNVVGQLRSQIDEHAPEDTISVLNRLVDNGVAEVSGGYASIGVLTAALIALWSGSNGMGALMKAFNRALNIEEGRPYARKRAVAVGLTLLLVALLNGAFVLLVYGKRMGQWIAEQIGAGAAFETVWDIGRWPLSLAAIVVVLGLLYLLGPNAKLTVSSILPGAVVATLLWLVAVFGFGFYLRFSNPGSAYGVLGGVIVLLFFLYLTAMILLVGAEVNAVVREEMSDNKTHSPAGPDQPEIDVV